MKVNGSLIPVYYFAQLEFLNHQELKKRALNLRDALGLQDSMVTACRESIITWILQTQAAAVGLPVTEFGPPLDRYGRASSPIRERDVSPVTETLRRRLAPSPMHEPMGDDDFEDDGLERCIGHGRKYIGTVDHLRNSAVAGEADAAGTHGHSKDDDFQGGLQRGIGHGRRKYADTGQMGAGVAAKAAGSPGGYPQGEALQNGAGRSPDHAVNGGAASNDGDWLHRRPGADPYENGPERLCSPQQPPSPERPSPERSTPARASFRTRPLQVTGLSW